MLHKVNKLASYHYTVMGVFKNPEPEPVKKEQCRFMMFVRLRPGVRSHFTNLSRTGYYPGDKYTDVESEMLVSLVRMMDKEVEKDRFDRMIIYDNAKDGADKRILMISDGKVSSRLNPYSLMFGKYKLPKWIP